jgi:hypothetical protein
MRALCRRWGAVVAEAPKVDGTPARALETIAIENAVEGCVRETYGAVLATWQAAHAGDARVRATLSKIARDETRHAMLSWEIAAWAERRLGAEARRRLTETRRRAVEALQSELASDPPRELVDTLGLPTRAQAARLLERMVRSLRVAPL